MFLKINDRTFYILEIFSENKRLFFGLGFIRTIAFRCVALTCIF